MGFVFDTGLTKISNPVPRSSSHIDVGHVYCALHTNQSLQFIPTGYLLGAYSALLKLSVPMDINSKDVETYNRRYPRVQYQERCIDSLSAASVK